MSLSLPLPLSDDYRLSARTYMLHTLPHITDYDANDLAEYTLGLISRRNKSIDELKRSTVNELSDFLESHTESFVNNLFQHLQSIHNQDAHDSNNSDNKHNSITDGLHGDIETNTATHDDANDVDAADNNDESTNEDDAVEDDMDSDRDTRRHQNNETRHDMTPADAADHYPAQQQRGGRYQRERRQHPYQRQPQRPPIYIDGNGQQTQQRLPYQTHSTPYSKQQQISTRNGRQIQLRQSNAHTAQPQIAIPHPMQQIQQMMQSAASSAKQVQAPSEDATSLFVTNVPDELNNMTALSAYFSCFGPVKQIKVLDGGKAQIDYNEAKHAQAAINSPAAVLNIRHIRLMWSKIQPNSATQRRQRHTKPLKQHQSPSLTSSQESTTKAVLVKSAADVAQEIAARRQQQQLQNTDDDATSTTAASSSPSPLPSTQPTQAATAPTNQTVGKRRSPASVSTCTPASTSPDQPSEGGSKAEELSALRSQYIQRLMKQQKELLSKLEQQKSTLSSEEKGSIMSKLKALASNIQNEINKQPNKKMKTENTAAVPS